MIKHPHILLKGRDDVDRLGANILSYICQIIFAEKNNYYIKYEEFKFESSIFISTLKKFIDNYNSDKIDSGEKINICFEINMGFCMHLNTVNLIKHDLFSYFQLKLKDKIESFLTEATLSLKYIIPFDPKNTILMHIRLDDLSEKNSFDYDGRILGDFLTECINTDSTFYLESDNLNLKKKLRDIYYSHQLKTIDKKKINKIPSIYSFLYQSILSNEKINLLLESIKTKYPYDEIVIVTSPKGNYSLPYRSIRSDNPDMDLYYLCNCEKIILSRSTFSLSAVFFSNAKEIWMPFFPISASLGIRSCYDKSNFNYFD